MELERYQYTEDEFMRQKCGLSRNPFPPATTGLEKDPDTRVWFPNEWTERFNRIYLLLANAQGIKAFPIVGAYGSGKSVFLRHYVAPYFQRNRIKPFYFKNPGTQFYDLANAVLQQLGRFEYVKGIWELCRERLDGQSCGQLFPATFDQVLAESDQKSRRADWSKRLATAIKNVGLTDNETVAFKLAQIVLDTRNRPYFEYRDFVAGRNSSLVAEKMEPLYFRALIRSIIQIYGVDGIAFIIDEFEDVAVQGRMTHNKSSEYLVTLRSLVDFSASENLWIITAMTPEAEEATKRLTVALWERFVEFDKNKLNLNPLSRRDADELLLWWLDTARLPDFEAPNRLFPFAEDTFDAFENRPDLLLPRRLVKCLFMSLARVVQERGVLPISTSTTIAVAEHLYPPEQVSHD
jgi:SAM-dependent methyltransferase